MKPKVTIQIPTYGQDKYIEKAIESALAQDYENLEVILCDDNSPDNTESVAKQFNSDPRFRYIKNEKNLGRVQNYHHCLYDLASGDYVLNLDGDDYLSDDKYISKAIILFEKYADIVMVFGRQKVLMEKNGEIIEDDISNKLPEYVDGNWLFLNVCKGIAIPHLTCLYKKEVAKKVGFYTLNIVSSDSESLFRLILDQKIGFLNSFAGVWRRHEFNKSKAMTKEEIFEAADFIEVPYKLALKKENISKNELINWRFNMLKRYFVKNFLKMYVLKKLKYSEIRQEIENYNLELSQKIFSDPKVAFLFLFSRNKFLMFILFKKIVKMESLYLDYLEMISNT